MATYLVMRLVRSRAGWQAAHDTALDGVFGNGYVPRVVDCWATHSTLVCHCGGPQDGAWLQHAASSLGLWSGTKLMVMEVHQFLKLERIKAFCPGARDPKGVSKRLAKQNETLNVLNCKLTSSKEVQIKKGEVETSLQIIGEYGRSDRAQSSGGHGVNIKTILWPQKGALCVLEPGRW